MIGAGFLPMIAGGLVGGLVSAAIMDTVGKLNESEIDIDVEMNEKFDLKKIKSYATKALKKLESFLFSNQVRLQRRIEVLYDQRKQKIKSISSAR
jgi:hypothetical protein